MDSVKINLPDGRKIVLTCTIVANLPCKKRYSIEESLLTRVRTFKYDTGSQITCLSAKELGIDISEQEFINKYSTLEVEGRGIDEKSKRIKYYSIQVEQFIINGINLGSVPIYITFDERVKKRLLGLDIIKLLNAQFDFDNKEAIFSKTQRLINFSKKKLRLEIKDLFEMGIYSIDDYEKDTDWQSIDTQKKVDNLEQIKNAAYVYEMINKEGIK